MSGDFGDFESTGCKSRLTSTGSNVEHPSHYNVGKIEVIDAIEDWQLDFHLGNVVKYCARAKHKGRELEDLRKAQWYLSRAIELRSKNECANGKTDS